MKVPLDEVVFMPSAEGRTAKLELVIAAQDTKGNRADIPVIPLTLQSTGKPAEGSIGSYETTLTLRRERHRVVFAVHDPLSGRILSAAAEISP